LRKIASAAGFENDVVAATIRANQAANPMMINAARTPGLPSVTPKINRMERSLFLFMVSPVGNR